MQITNHTAYFCDRFLTKASELCCKAYKISRFVLTHPLFLAVGGLGAAYFAPSAYTSLLNQGAVFYPPLKSLVFTPAFQGFQWILKHQLHIFSSYWGSTFATRRWPTALRVVNFTFEMLLFPSQFWTYPVKMIR